MTKYTIVNFQLSRGGIVMIVIGALLVAALLAGAGYIAGSMAVAKKHAAQPPPAAAPPPPPATTTATTATAPAEEFSLRVKTVGSEEEAKALQADLKGKQIEAAIVPLPAADGVVIYSVETGRYPSRRAAADASAALADKKGVDTVVVPAAPLPKPPG